MFRRKKTRLEPTLPSPTQTSNLTSTIGLNVTFRFPLLMNSAHILSLTRRPRGTSHFLLLTTMMSTFAGLSAAPMSSILPESAADAFLWAFPSAPLLPQAEGFRVVCWRCRHRPSGCSRRIPGVIFDEMLLLRWAILGSVHVAGAERRRVAFLSLWQKMRARPVVGDGTNEADIPLTRRELGDEGRGLFSTQYQQSTPCSTETLHARRLYCKSSAGS